MKAIVADKLTKMFGQLVAVDHISFEQVLTSSQGWKPTEKWGQLYFSPRPVTARLSKSAQAIPPGRAWEEK